jgi:hypothetical protein
VKIILSGFIVFVQTIGSYNNDNIYLELPALQTKYIYSDYAQCAEKATDLKKKLSEDIEYIFYQDEPSSNSLSAWPSLMPNHDNISFKCVPH